MNVPKPGARRPARSKVYLLALRELGAQAVFQYALYRAGLVSGYLRYATRGPEISATPGVIAAPQAIYRPPDRDELAAILGARGVEAALQEAGLAAGGRMRLFGGDVVEICLKPPQPLYHWTQYELHRAVVDQDVKFIWEPARLGWAVTLARGYVLSGDERFAAAFWELLEAFLEANPPYLGLNWASGQEAGIRLLVLSFAWGVFHRSPHSTPERAARLAGSIGVHAARIPPTLAYARAQNNNHLLSEAAGLYTAGLAIPRHPRAGQWRAVGWRWLHRGFAAQIDDDGVYTQHSANYQRLMLQIALWVGRISSGAGEAFPRLSLERLAAGTGWLARLLDRGSGRTPNLGPNDSAYLFPLSNLPVEDYRSTLQTASQVFCGKKLLDEGPWDEMNAWLGRQGGSSALSGAAEGPGSGRPCEGAGRVTPSSPHTLHAPGGESWAYLRLARFNGRPGHADQLHLDLWWRGLNVAQDAGTYLYNAPAPWDNALAGCDVHNTVTVDDQDQMLRAGRFLYLGRANAEVIEKGAQLNLGWKGLSAQHDGYQRLGVTHQRTVAVSDQGVWLVEDTLLASPGGPGGDAEHNACLTWMLQDWAWEVVEEDGATLSEGEQAGGVELRFSSPEGPLWLLLRAGGRPGGHLPAKLQIVRAGALVYGAGPVRPTWGWRSSRYGEKRPALAVKLYIYGSLPLKFSSEWRFGANSRSA